MKLYTEEQVKNMIEKSRETGLTAEYLILTTKPIELPSDEEIGKEMDKLPFSKHIDDGLFNDGQLSGFELGAQWMRDKILNK